MTVPSEIAGDGGAHIETCHCANLSVKFSRSKAGDARSYIGTHTYHMTFAIQYIQTIYSMHKSTIKQLD